jgi:hypothetical protein
VQEKLEIAVYAVAGMAGAALVILTARALGWF